MVRFIIACVVAGLFFIGSLVLWITSFIIKDGKKPVRVIAVLLMIGAVFYVGGAQCEYHHCPNCDYFTDAAFCQECGAEMNPTINCSNCKKDFNTNDVNKVPAFCPDCGTKVKE